MAFLLFKYMLANNNVELIASSEGCIYFSKDFLLREMNQFKSQMFSELKSFMEEMSKLTKSTEFVSNKINTSNTMMSEIPRNQKL